MALIGSASVWRDAIVAGIDTTGLSVAEVTTLKAFWLVICQAHETHIVTNALLNTIVATPNTLVGTGQGIPPITGIK